MKFILPIRVKVTQKKYFRLNLNEYRNTHFQTLNKAKILFKEEIAAQLAGIPRLSHISAHYRLFSGSNREIDVANVCSIVDKFFMDAFVEAGCLVDDNMTILPEVTYSFGGVDKLNPRVEVTIKNLAEKEPENENHPVSSGNCRTDSVPVYQPVQRLCCHSFDFAES